METDFIILLGTIFCHAVKNLSAMDHFPFHSM